MTWMMHTPFLAFVVPSTGAVLLQRWATALDERFKGMGPSAQLGVLRLPTLRSRLRIRLPTKKKARHLSESSLLLQTSRFPHCAFTTFPLFIRAVSIAPPKVASLYCTEKHLSTKGEDQSFQKRTLGMEGRQSHASWNRDCGAGNEREHSGV